MSRFVKFLIVTLTLGRIKWLMRLTWLWRFIVFLGVTKWLSTLLRRIVGLDKKPSTDIDSAWAEALRYTPQAPTTAPGAAPMAPTAPPAEPEAPTPASEFGEVSESISEVTGTTSDGATETITIHEVDAAGESESIVRIEDDAGHVETLVTGSPVEEIDLAGLGESATEPAGMPEAAVEESAPEEPVVETIIEVVELASADEIEINELIEPLASEETEPVGAVPAESAAEPATAEQDRPTAAVAESIEAVAEPVEAVAEESEADTERAEVETEPTEAELEPELPADPDWVRGDGSHDCPASHPVKAKANSMIYYLPESGHYDRTIPDVCFASDLDAEAAGYRPPRR